MCLLFESEAVRATTVRRIALNSVMAFRRTTSIAFALMCVATATLHIGSARSEPVHGIAMHGTPAYPADFKHFSYANPDAPKGGTVTYAAMGTFNSTNPMIVKGIAAAGLRAHVFESLMARALDENFSLYGLIAESIETPDDRSWVEFQIRPEAKFSDGAPIRAADVVFSLETLRDHGRPNHRSFYKKVMRIETPDEQTVRFVLSQPADREMPLILGLMPILPKHHYNKESFEQTTLKPPLGSGPYVVDEITAGKAITYRRNPDYWGAHLGANAGRHNFDQIRYDYYRDKNTAFEAFKKGLYDIRSETDPTRWARGYDFPAVNTRDVLKEEIPTSLPSGMNALVFNTRRDLMSDVRVRRALIAVFDFEWINKNLYFSLYSRTQSYFHNSELGAIGRKLEGDEQILLAPYAASLDKSVLDGTFRQPKTDGSGRIRQNRREAIALFKQAGYDFRDGLMVNTKSGAPASFEILVVNREQERLVLNYARNLKSIGIQARIRQVDSAQFQNRKQTYDFDMIPIFWPASLSPGNEQSFYWGSQGREQNGTRNYMGAANPAIDAMIEAMLRAHGRDSFVSAARALDRILISQSYMVPLYYLPRRWVARWKHIEHPKKQSLYGYVLDTWWHVPE